MKFQTLITNLAAYDCDSYGAGAYDEPQQCGSGLADTGYDIIVPVALAVAILGASIILLVKRLKHRRKS